MARGSLASASLHLLASACACLASHFCLPLSPPCPLHPPHTHLQDVKSLTHQKRNLQGALNQSQREANALATQLERASALADLLDEAQNDAATAKAQAISARGRIALLEKAWAAALEVCGWEWMRMGAVGGDGMGQNAGGVGSICRRRWLVSSACLLSGAPAPALPVPTAPVADHSPSSPLLLLPLLQDAKQLRSTQKQLEMMLQQVQRLAIY